VGNLYSSWVFLALDFEEGIMNPALAQHLVEFLRREKPVLRELPIPAYVERLLEEIESAGFSIRKKSDKFTPSVEAHKRYLAKLDTWKENFDFKAFHEAFPNHDLRGELAKAHLWLVNHAGQGGYRTRFNQFFQNWLQKAKPVTITGSQSAQPESQREVVIRRGIEDLASSRSERVWPEEMNRRVRLAVHDLLDIPTEALPEAFQRARLTEMKGTPGVYQVLLAYKAMKIEAKTQAERAQKKAIADEKYRVEQELESMSPEQRLAHAEIVRKSLHAANKGIKEV
jgi:hypothetical protein